MATAFEQKGATWRQKFQSFAGTLVDVVFPPVCAGCGAIGELFCSECRDRVIWIREPICDKCGRSQAAALDACRVCQQTPLTLHRIRTATRYEGPVAETIKKFKYSGYFALANPLADLMLAAWPAWEEPVDVVVPVPLHAARQRERGYNQAELLAQKMERELKWQVETAALKRVRRTRPQVGLNSSERHANVRGAFVTEPNLVRGRRILLIDDVHTTGATLDAAAEVLLAAGANSVSAYCLAGAGGAEDFSENDVENLEIFDNI